jgi:hypothetical protein
MAEERTRRSDAEVERELWEIQFATKEDCVILLARLWDDNVRLSLSSSPTVIRLLKKDFDQLPQTSLDVYQRLISAGVVTRPAGPAPRPGPSSRRRMPTPEEASELHRQFAERRQLRREERRP